MSSDVALRKQLVDLLTWNSAHAEFDRAVKNVPPDLRGVRPEGLPYSLWELLEHIRLAQHDILEFCRNPGYTSPRWPDDFWPREPSPGRRGEWKASIDAIHRDRQEIIDLVRNQDDLTERVPGGEGQTFLREAFLVADHNAYHVGQMVVVRRLLGIWPP